MSGYLFEIQPIINDYDKGLRPGCYVCSGPSGLRANRGGLGSGLHAGGLRRRWRVWKRTLN